jgi:hypothetical protein
MAMTVRNSLRVFPGVLLAALMASCEKEGPVVEVTETRTVESLPKGPAPDATSAERFGYEQRAAAPAPAAAGPSTETAGLPFTWTAPEGWQQAPERPMRVVTFTTGPNREAECYVTILGQGGGGVEANINRWRMQMGQEPLSEERIAALPEIAVLGRPSKWVEIRGTFTSRSGEPLENAVMLGLVCAVEEFSVFVKMTGPADVVGPQRDNFLAFCQSLTWSQSTN